MSDDRTYTSIWTDYLRGLVLGATTHSFSVAVLIIFLTLVLSAAGSRSWPIVVPIFLQHLSIAVQELDFDMGASHSPKFEHV